MELVIWSSLELNHVFFLSVFLSECNFACSRVIVHNDYIVLVERK